ncbi:endonuclease III [Amorphus sp. MBR-141]
MASRKAEAPTVKDLLRDAGSTYAGELGIDLAKNTPSPLFRWLCASLLLSTRISADLAMNAAKELARAGWRTPEKMAAATWEQRTKVLNEAGYARYDESTSRRLAEVSEKLLDAYGGDLRRLRKQAGEDPKRMRDLLKDFKGIGDVGADIFCREVQAAWPELYPFVDQKSVDSAKKLGLASSKEAVAKLVPQKDLPRLLAALVRTDLRH